MVKVKICGITNLGDAENAFKLNADLLGFIFIKGTPRYAENAREIISRLGPGMKSKKGITGLFKDEETGSVVEKVLSCGLDYVQLHGGEKPDYCEVLKKELEKNGREVRVIKAFKVAERILLPAGYGLSDYSAADFFVFDTYQSGRSGGTGKRFNLDVLINEKDKIKKPFFVAGGLAPDNVAEVIKKVRPFGVDVSSGVERSCGKKDNEKLKEFIKNAKNA